MKTHFLTQLARLFLCAAYGVGSVLKTPMRAFVIHPLLCLAALSITHGADHEVKLSVGMDREEALAFIKTHHGRDITAKVGTVKRGGDNPKAEVYWEFKNHDAVIEVRSTDGRISELTFWTKEGFVKIRRHETAQAIKALTLDTKSGEVSVEKREASQS